ncbi:uncharacterized protein SAPINGB_P000874 [Magnusiomyces paraingens]|uniref:Tethering factor for nuclear proteasome STS1 n=1 Tax=Magnusiomyces paraingens TaxID=2606893 RepID=A0A5E8B2T8_9ASCO|nr:uncharacterized protein SAPINGB_P000874 [Saprochaete ingens]VVT45754.1 unnamed protein product [Saprochaete ingens]
MGLNAVLPPSTGWGFQFHASAAQNQQQLHNHHHHHHHLHQQQQQQQQQQSLTASHGPASNSHSSALNSSNPCDQTATALHLSHLSVSRPKRKLHDDIPRQDDSDEESSIQKQSSSFFSSTESRRSLLRKQPSPPLASSSSILSSSTLQKNMAKIGKQSPLKQSKPTKRARFDRMSGRPLPVARLVETLDKKALETLVTALVHARPDMAPAIHALAPAVSVASALTALSAKLETIFLGLPYKGDQAGDYAYLRVRPAIDDFLAALADYTAHFLPPNETQPSNSLAFLDAATMLLHKLPTWASPENNHARTVAYDRIAAAWVLALQEAEKRANGLGLAYGGWQHKLDNHNELSGQLLTPAASYLRNALRWMNDQNHQSNYNNHFYYNNADIPQGSAAAAGIVPTGPPSAPVIPATGVFSKYSSGPSNWS